MLWHHTEEGNLLRQISYIILRPMQSADYTITEHDDDREKAV